MSKVHLITAKPAIADANVDLIAYIDSIADVWSAWRLASTYTWKLDGMITQITSALFNQTREKYAAANGMQMLNEVSTLLAFEGAAAQAFQDAGFDRAGPITNLHNLLSLRDEAYELERELCSCSNPDIEVDKDRVDPITGMTYKALFKKIDISELFLDFDPRTPNMNERTRFEVEVLKIALSSYDTKEDQDEFVATELAAFDEQQRKDCDVFNDGLARNAPVKQHIIEQVMALDITEVKFTYELSTDVLKTLLAHMRAAIPRTKEWNRKRYNVTPLEKSLATAELDKFERSMEASLRTPRFNEGVAFAPAVRRAFRSVAA